MGIPYKFVDRLQTCISTAWFSIKINGMLEGCFQGMNEVCQGDPLL